MWIGIKKCVNYLKYVQFTYQGQVIDNLKLENKQIYEVTYHRNRCYLPHCISIVKGLCEQPVTLLMHFVSMECLLASKKRKCLVVVVVEK